MNMYRAVLEKWEEETNQKDKYARTGIGLYFAAGKGGGLAVLLTRINHFKFGS